MATLLASIVLYAPGAFFFYPWKPVMQLLVGDPYEVGYKYFRRDHSDASNLCLHVVALIWQVFSNFGLLTLLDDALLPPSMAPLRPLATSTAILWAVTLFLSPAPLVCSFASTLSIGLAYAVSPHLAARTLEVGAMAAFVAVLVATSIALPSKKTKRSLPKDLLHAAKMFGLALLMRLGAAPWAGQLVGSEAKANVAVLVVMAILGALPKPTKPCVVGGMLLARALGELTSQDALIFYGNAFVAQLSQGVAHDVSLQPATLLSHEEDEGHGRAIKLAFEWSHVAYFPNLLFHSVHDSIFDTGKKGKKRL